MTRSRFSAFASLRVAILLATASYCPASAAIARAATDGALILESSRVEATVDPRNGGALTSFIGKSNRKEMLSAPSFVDSNLLVGRRIQELGEQAFKVVRQGLRRSRSV